MMALKLCNFFFFKVSVIESEKERRNERLRGHYKNTVWEKRDTPPDDWNKPLPESLQSNDEVWYFTYTFQTPITINCNI